MDKKVRHLSEASRSCTKGLFIKSKLRTYFLDYVYEKSTQLVHHFHVRKLLANMMSLRALDLSHLEIQSLPSAIGGLLHLRYLDLSYNRKWEVLPKSITKLHNLQTLLLEGCDELGELPKDFIKLVHLRVLDTTYCTCLSYMPSGLKKLTGLCKLTMFVVGGRSSSSKQGFRELEDLGALEKLKGSFRIVIRGNYRYVKEKHGEGARYLSNKEHLNYINIEWRSGREYEGRVQEQEALLEDLQPHCNLKELSIGYYRGERIPRWGREDKLATCLPNLVKIMLESCQDLQELPWLSKLCCLKSLSLSNLKKFQYMENNNNDNTSRSSSSSNYGGGGGGGVREIESSCSVLFFPSLEELVLNCLPKLKGWWVRCGLGVLPAFPRLSKLTILFCQDLTSFPPCPNLETLLLRDGVNEILRIKEDENHRYDSKLKRVEVYENVGTFKCLPIKSDKEVESTPGGVVEEVFRTCSSSIRILFIGSCSKLRRVSGGGLEHLTVLEQLSLYDLNELNFVDNDDDHMPWRSLSQSLRELKLIKLPKMVKLPKGMRHLTSLQSLYINNCPALKELAEWIGDGCFSSLRSLKIKRSKIESLPDAMRNLTSLTTLDIGYCTLALKERCQAQNPQGEDWPKIHHIPSLTISLGWD